MQTRYRTEYQTKIVPVTRWVSEQVPMTIVTTQQRQVPRQVAVTRCVMVPVTRPAATAQTAIPAPAPSPQK